METEAPEAAYQEGAEHVKADEIDDGEVAPASVFLSGVVIWVRVTQFPWEAGKHDLLPGFPCGTPV